MPLRTIISHPICYMVLVFLFTIGAFEYAVASLKTVRPHSLCEKLSFSVGDGNPSVKIGCSIGIVTDTEKSDFSKIYQEADKTLYSAKSKGKGRYCFS